MGSGQVPFRMSGNDLSPHDLSVVLPSTSQRPPAPSSQVLYRTRDRELTRLACRHHRARRAGAAGLPGAPCDWPMSLIVSSQHGVHPCQAALLQVIRASSSGRTARIPKLGASPPSLPPSPCHCPCQDGRTGPRTGSGTVTREGSGPLATAVAQSSGPPPGSENALGHAARTGESRDMAVQEPRFCG